MFKNPYHNTILIYTLGGIAGLVGIYFFDRYLKVKNKAAQEAKKEWNIWDNQELDINNNTIKEGRKEFESGYIQKVGDYWREGVGLTYDGNDRDVAWSAAFISSMMKRAGAKNRFKYSASHSDYIRDSINNRKNNDFKKPFLGFKLNEYAPKVGDLICYSRESSSNLYDANYPYKSHCDIVVKTGKNYIDVIGGNVNQSVSKKRLRTDDKGYLVDKNYKWFAVIKSNI
jgi:hypothetical protein